MKTDRILKICLLKNCISPPAKVLSLPCWVLEDCRAAKSIVYGLKIKWCGQRLIWPGNCWLTYSEPHGRQVSCVFIPVYRRLHLFCQGKCKHWKICQYAQKYLGPHLPSAYLQPGSSTHPLQKHWNQTWRWLPYYVLVAEQSWKKYMLVNVSWDCWV